MNPSERRDEKGVGKIGSENIYYMSFVNIMGDDEWEGGKASSENI